MKWQTKITNEASDTDLRATFPYLLKSAIGLIGVNTGKQVQVRAYEEEKDPTLCYILHGDLCDPQTGQPRAPIAQP